jgi:hypothetical protein
VVPGYPRGCLGAAKPHQGGQANRQCQAELRWGEALLCPWSQVYCHCSLQEINPLHSLSWDAKQQVQWHYGTWKTAIYKVLQQFYCGHFQ